MSRQRQEQLLATLVRQGGWSTAGTLADLRAHTRSTIEANDF